MVKNDFNNINEVFDEAKIKAEYIKEYKTSIKGKITNLAFKNLKQSQQSHSKVREICYKTFVIQDYMITHKMNNHKVTLLFALRSKTVKNVKANTKSIYLNLNCELCDTDIDNQEHCLKCPKISSNIDIVNVQYEDIFSDNIDKQVAVTQAFSKILEEREQLLEFAANPPVATGPCTPVSAVNIH